MAKEITSRLSWYSTRSFPVIPLFAMLWLSFCCGFNLCGADAIPDPSPVPAVVSLDYQETENALFNWSVNAKLQAPAFKKEPPAVSEQTIRGTLNFPGKVRDPLPFLWQRNAGKLFLDVIGNQDFTSDKVEKYSGKILSPIYQTFTNIHLVLNSPGGKYPVLVDINFVNLGDQLNCSLATRCFWQGKVTLHGQDWQVGIVPNMFETASLTSGRLLLRPWDNRSRSFSAMEGSLEAFSFTTNLFFGGHAYRLAWLNDSPAGKPTLQFTAQTIPLGELEINGKYIERMVLHGGTYLSIFDRPAEKVKIPLGSYNPPNIRLAQSGSKIAYNPGLLQPGKPFYVDGKSNVILTAGGPLTNSVTVSRHGQDLRMDYQLIGAGGVTCPPNSLSPPPRFSIYQAGKPIASGNFEFG